MKKKYFSGLAIAAMLAGAPTMTSCNEDTANAIIEILNTLLSVDDLTNTAWIATDNSLALEFGTGGQGNYYVSEEPVSMTYKLDENTLTLTFSDQTITYTVTEFVKGEKLVLLTNQNVTITLVPYTEEEG